MKRSRLSSAAIAFILVLGAGNRAAAQESEVLLPIPATSRYEKDPDKLSESDRWRILIHGLRMAPLDPRIWGIRRTERTENRRLVPMRPFVLRQSVDPMYFVREISFKFKFARSTKKEMLRNPHARVPLLDVWFNGEYSQNKGKIEVDRGYFLRLTAFPEFESGFFYHSLGKIKKISVLPSELIKTAEEHMVTLSVSSDQAVLLLDGETKLKIKANQINKGSVAIMTGWHPVKMSDLRVSGFKLFPDGSAEPLEAAGLVNVPKIKKKR